MRNVRMCLVLRSKIKQQSAAPMPDLGIFEQTSVVLAYFGRFISEAVIFLRSSWEGVTFQNT